jgi:hypothetical protein
MGQLSTISFLNLENASPSFAVDHSFRFGKPLKLSSSSDGNDLRISSP